MAVRLQEVHPAVVHFPIALLPAAIGADLLGRLLHSRPLIETGRRLMPLAAASAAVSAITGLVAQAEVQVDGRARELLVSHRTLNASVVGLATTLAAWRWRRRTPSAGYIALGIASIGVVGYSAYLGSKMVYEHGVGVDAAGGIRTGGGAKFKRGQAAAAVRTAAGDMMRGLPHAVANLVRGAVVPALHDGPDYPARGSIAGPRGSTPHT